MPVHPLFGYHWTPNLRIRVDHEGGGFLLRTNSAGFRSDHDFEQQTKSGIFRVLVFGDSSTAGDGVSNRARYTDLVEQRLPNVEVYNLALYGSGFDQQYLVFREIVRATGMQYDLLVIAPRTDDISRNFAHYQIWGKADDGTLIWYPKPYFELGASNELELRNVPISPEPLDVRSFTGEQHADVHRHRDSGRRFERARLLVRRLGPRAKDIAQRVSRFNPTPGYNQPAGREWRLSRRILEVWLKQAEAPVLLFPVPVYQQAEGTAPTRAYRARFRELERPPGVEFVDAIPEFSKYGGTVRRSFRFRTDTHPNAAGHRVLADALEPAIRSRIPAREGVAT